MDDRELDQRLTNIEEALEQILLILATEEKNTENKDTNEDEELDETDEEELDQIEIPDNYAEDEELEDTEEEEIKPPTKPTNKTYALKNKEPRE